MQTLLLISRGRNSGYCVLVIVLIVKLFVLPSLYHWFYFYFLTITYTFKHSVVCSFITPISFTPHVFILNSLAPLRTQEVHSWEPERIWPYAPSVKVTAANFVAKVQQNHKMQSGSSEFPREKRSLIL